LILVSLCQASCGKKGGGFIPPSPFGPPPEPEEPEVARIMERPAGRFA